MTEEFYHARNAGNGFYLSRVPEQPPVGGPISHKFLTLDAPVGFTGPGVFTIAMDINYDEYYFSIASYILGSDVNVQAFRFYDVNGEAWLDVTLGLGAVETSAHINVLALSRQLF